MKGIISGLVVLAIIAVVVVLVLKKSKSKKGANGLSVYDNGKSGVDYSAIVKAIKSMAEGDFSFTLPCDENCDEQVKSIVDAIESLKTSLSERVNGSNLAVDKATKKVICGWFEIQETTRAYFMKLINNDNDDYIPIIKNQLREHFKK